MSEMEDKVWCQKCQDWHEYEEAKDEVQAARWLEEMRENEPMVQT